MLAGRCIFFYVYLYVCILLLEVYIQGCVFIYKNAYLKRMYKKEKCIHYVAHFFLQAAAGRILKMYTHACTHKKPSQLAGIRYFPPLPILPAFFRSRYTHRNTPLPPSPSSAIYFLHLFFFVSPNDRQRWQLRKILHKTKQEEKSCKRKPQNKRKQKKYKNKRICRNKKNVFVNRGFPRTSIKSKRKIKKSKG